MNKKAIERLFSLIPEGKKKQELYEKYMRLQNEKSKERGGNGLNDTFEFKPVGHIKIESIDENGNVIGTLADQANLVVNGSEEIMLRAFSGDPDRILYKNRIPKTNPTEVILIDEHILQGKSITDGDQLLHAPNIIWSAVNDNDFEIEYSYTQNIVYLKEVETTEPNKRAFVLSKDAQPGYIPLPAEIYSTYTNLFIGIGDGKNIPVDLNDSRLSYSEGLKPEGGKVSTTTEGHEVSFTEKISNFELEFEASNQGAQIDVYINDNLVETIETYDSNLTEPEIRRFVYDGLNHEVETKVRLVHSGSDHGVSDPMMTITGLAFDALSKDMNHLIHEFENYELEFDTPTVFNTSSMDPFIIQLPNKPVEPGSVKVLYNETEFIEVEKEEDLNDVTFILDPVHGVLRFNRALSGVQITYKVTGEIYDKELKNGSQMTAENIIGTKEEIVKVTDETPAGSVDGVNQVFTVAHKGLIDGTVVVKINETPLTSEEIEEIDLVNGVVTLTNAPESENIISIDYEYKEVKTITNPALSYKAEYRVNPNSVKILDQDGTALTEVTDVNEFGNGTFLIDKNDPYVIHISANKANGQAIELVEIIYRSDERPGVPTNYKRALIEKPKKVNEYPWFELDKGSVRFVADFPEFVPASNVTIREMGLFDGPRTDDGVKGYNGYPVKAFSLVRLGETVKDVNTGIRITWTITLLNADNEPFKGGNN